LISSTILPFRAWRRKIGGATSMDFPAFQTYNK